MAITLTERAAEKIKSVFSQQDMPADGCLRLGVKGGGCAGFDYTLDVTDKPAEDDQIFVCHDVRVVCDPKSYLYLNGTEVDYDDDLLKSRFVFNNPQAKRSCNCGASFSA